MGINSSNVFLNVYSEEGTLLKNHQINVYNWYRIQYCFFRNYELQNFTLVAFDSNHIDS